MFIEKRVCLLSNHDDYEKSGLFQRSKHCYFFYSRTHHLSRKIIHSFPRGYYRRFIRALLSSCGGVDMTTGLYKIEVKSYSNKK